MGAAVLLALGAVFVAYSQLSSSRKSLLAAAIIVPFGVAMVALALQSPAGARIAVKEWMDSSLGLPIIEKVYDENCESWQAFLEAIDLFVLAHTVGWLFSTLTVRSWRMAFLMGVIDELVEVAFACRHPNFAECWWDHGLDIVCNLVGATTGAWLCTKVGMQPYKWFENATTDVVKQLAIVHIITARVAVFLCIFGAKYVYWIPDPHWFNMVHPFFQCVLVERITAEHFTAPASNALVSRVRWWLIGGWTLWVVQLAGIAKHGYFGPCIFEGPLRTSVMWLGMVACLVTGLILTAQRIMGNDPDWLLRPAVTKGNKDSSSKKLQ